MRAQGGEASAAPQVRAGIGGADLAVGARMNRVEARLDALARALHRLIVGVRGDVNEFADNDRAAAERFAETGAVPRLEIETTAGDDRGRRDRTAGKLGEQHDASAGDARALGDIG